MRSLLYVTIIGLVLCSTGEATADQSRTEPERTSAAAAPAHYVALGMRALAHDPTALVLAGKAELLAAGSVRGSVRGALMYGDYFEARIPITVEAALIPRTAPFLGAGLAYNTDGLARVDLMITGGFDLRVTRRITLGATVNIIWQRAISDTDKEGMGTVGIVF